LTIVDHSETYGRHVLDALCRGMAISASVDLGCGAGGDLATIKRHHPDARCIGVDLGDWNREGLVRQGIESLSLDIESAPLPFENESVDLVIANQVLEHTKQIFFINHEIFRTLKVGGHLYVGVPNVLSLHNRFLALLGIHPTCAKLISGHMRVYSKSDVLFFYRTIADRFVQLESFYGAQFYPLPRRLSRPLSAALPSLAVSIFFLFRKTAAYDGEFLEWLSKAHLETNFYTGRAATGS